MKAVFHKCNANATRCNAKQPRRGRLGPSGLFYVSEPVDLSAFQQIKQLLVSLAEFRVQTVEAFGMFAVEIVDAVVECAGFSIQFGDAGIFFGELIAEMGGFGFQ